ncbi:MAG: TolC family protein [Tannerellaceae bacterium]|jgi:outer membrane protein TolC|nr:TolC family protein [Tannerellaceae bacterium]
MLFPAEAEAAGEGVVLTLEEALRVGMSESPSVKVADREVEKKRYGRKGAYAALFPQLSFGADYSRMLKKQVMYMDGAFDMTAMMMPTFQGIDKTFQDVSSGYQPGSLLENIQEATPTVEDSGNEGISVGRDNNWGFGFTGGMPLINLSLWKSLSISAADVELAVELARSSRIEMANQVKRAFYGVLLANDSYRVLKESFEHAKANFEDVSLKFDQGVVAEYDKIRADVAVRNVEPNLFQAANGAILAKWQLKALLGLDLEMEVECKGQLTDYEEALFEGCLATDRGTEDNSALRQLDIQDLLLHRTLSMQKADFLPTLSLSGAYNWSAMNNDFKFKDYLWNPYSTVSLSLSFPLFQGGARLQKINQTRISLEQLHLQRDNLVRNLKLAIKQYKDNMETCVKRYQAARRGMEQAERGRLIARKRYETGAGTLLELNDAELALTQSKLNFNQAIYDFMVTQADMEKTIGGK